MRKLWDYRRFVLGMAQREFEQRYLGSALGSLWVVLNPLAMILVYTVVFGQIMRHRLPGLDDGLSYGIFLCAGLLPWGMFTEILQRSTSVFLDEGNLIKKVSFPRTTLPAIVLFSSTLNFMIAMLVLGVLLLLTGRLPGWAILGYLPLVLLQQLIAVGLGVGLGVLNVFFRDVGQMVGILLQYWFWFTPIVYPLGVLPEWAQTALMLNPMTRIMVGYQEILLDGRFPNLVPLIPHALLALAALWFGRVTYRRFSPEMPDFL
ncbi:MAG: ABC transporter permease [Deltaproteobacteria bacterium]